MSTYNTRSSRYTQKSLYKKLVLRLFFAAVLLAAITAFFYLPKFRVKNIFIQDNSVLRSRIKEEIEKALQDKIFSIFPADNYFLLRKKLLSDIVLQNMPGVKLINFNREFPDTLIVSFEERKQIVLWCRLAENEVPDTETISPSCYFIDEDGVAFKSSGSGILEFSPGFLSLDGERINLGDSVITKELLRHFLEFLEGADNFFQLEAEKIILEENYYKIYFKEGKEGWFVLMDKETNFGNAFENLRLVLNSQIKEKRAELEYIDLRFANKVFFK